MPRSKTETETEKRQRYFTLSGEQWLVNGEGLAGCVAQIPMAAFLYWKLL